MNVATLGIGQGGSSLADALATAFKSNARGVLNLSAGDLKTSANVKDDFRLLLGNGKVDGAGKDREFSKQYFMDYESDISSLIWKIINSQDNIDILFICFSTSGGTGSGLGPAITAYVNSQKFASQGKKRPIVFGVAACADTHEGLKNQQNTIEALREVSKLSENKLARFILVNNDIEGNTTDAQKKYAAINDKVASYIYRYFEGINTSRLGNLDKQDRLVALALPGVHSFCEFNPENPTEISSAFILPEGARVRGIYGEILEGTSASIDSITSQLGIQADDRTVGFYEPTVTSFPILHFAGFSNLKKVTERYQNVISQIQARSTQAEKNDKTSGAGFNRIDANKDWMAESYQTKSAGGAEDIMALING